MEPEIGGATGLFFGGSFKQSQDFIPTYRTICFFGDLIYYIHIIIMYRYISLLISWWSYIPTYTNLGSKDLQRIHKLTYPSPKSHPAPLRSVAIPQPISWHRRGVMEIFGGFMKFLGISHGFSGTLWVSVGERHSNGGISMVEYIMLYHQQVWTYVCLKKTDTSFFKAILWSAIIKCV